jgi:cell division protein FtsW
MSYQRSVDTPAAAPIAWFDRSRRSPDFVLMATVVALVAFGLVMVYSASFVEALVYYDNPFYYLMRQSAGALIGLSGMTVMMYLDHRKLREHSILIMAGAITGLILVLILPAEMTEVNGARSWIRFGDGLLGIFSVQPSEYAKLAAIIYFAHWLSRRSQRIGQITYGLAPFALMLGGLASLVILEPDLGTTIVLVVIGGAVFFAAGANILHLAGAVLISGGFFFFLISTFRSARLDAFRDPWAYADSYGYQIIHALYALGSGGLFGQGLGFSRQKYQWLPQAHTDTIYAIIGEELGLIGTVGVLIAFAVIAYRGYYIAGRAPSAFAGLTAVGVTSWIVFQALINIAVTVTLVPFTGLTLPFISYGSTSLISCLLGVGVLLNISRHITVPRAEENPDAERAERPSRLNRVILPDSLGGRDGRARLPGAGRRSGAFE